MTKRFLLVAAFALLVCRPASASNYGPPFLQVAAWTNIGATTRYPASGTYDLSDYAYIGGIIGLDPAGQTSRGVVTFFWTTDTAGSHIVGVQGFHLASQIVSTNQIRLPNQGPYLYVIYQPFLGPNPLAINFFGTNVGNALQEIPGDTILIDEQNRTLAPGATATIYPADYFAGEMRLWLAAASGLVVTLYGFDLTDQWWPLDSTGNGSITTVAPMGSWFVFLYNATGSAVTYSVAATPLLASTTR